MSVLPLIVWRLKREKLAFAGAPGAFAATALAALAFDALVSASTDFGKYPACLSAPTASFATRLR
jgi:hypothetical protein